MTLLAGRYQLEEQIAVGGMGEIWRARDVTLDRVVAVKRLRTHHAQDAEFLARFRNEARHTAGLSHPGLANVFDYGEDGGTPYLVMEYVDGEPLSALLAREQRLSPDRALDYVGQAALALQAAHDAGVIHRDVKPANLLVRPDGVVKVTDFGIARAAGDAPVTQIGLVVGTAAYLSPEQASGQTVTPASDVYALGLVGYECLAGRRAFDGDSAVAVATAQVHQQPPPLPKDVPPLVVQFVMRALEKDPQRRQPDAGDFGRTALALAAAMRAGTTDTATPAAAGMAPVPTKHLPVVDEDAQRRKTRNVFIGIGAGVVALGFLLLRACSPETTTPKRAAATPSASPTPTAVTVRAADYVGDPVASARAALLADHLRVRVTSTPTARPAGTVVAVAPTGALRPGSVVTLVVATPPPAPAEGGGDGKHGKGRHGGHGDH